MDGVRMSVVCINNVHYCEQYILIMPSTSIKHD